MARKLKTYTTSAGFFDLAIAAPSMKAALEAWGAESNLFHQGFAKQSEEPEIVAATMAKPGLVLRRPVGTNAAFSENAELPTHLGSPNVRRPPAKTRTASRKPAEPIDEKSAREAALAFEREQNRRERRARRDEVAREKEQARRDSATAAAAAALEEAKRGHQKTVEDIEKARLALDRKLEAEKARWKKKKSQLEGALRRAQGPRRP